MITRDEICFFFNGITMKYYSFPYFVLAARELRLLYPRAGRTKEGRKKVKRILPCTGIT